MLERAFDKCARLRPGEKPNLAPLEEKILAEALRSGLGKRREARQRMRQERLRKLGWSEEKIERARVIPWGILLFNNMDLTQAEKEHASIIQRTIAQ